MSYKTILVHVNESEHAYERIKVAARLAHRFDAHLLGVAATALPGTYYMPGIFGESGVSLLAYLELLREQAKNALAELEAVARKTGVASLEKRLVEDEAGAAVSLHARHSDLAVVGQTDPEESLPALRRDFPELVVMHSGCPVLVIPYAGEFDSVGKRVMIAWNASVEAVRAVAGAIPLLRQADEVQVVVYDTAADLSGEKPVAHLGPFLARHGIKADITPRATRTIDIGNVLLSQAADFNADLMVIGCYGHARFREALLGGVTQTILESMTVPTLMCH